jgi:hypothetical protein
MPPLFCTNTSTPSLFYTDTSTPPLFRALFSLGGIGFASIVLMLWAFWSVPCAYAIPVTPPIERSVFNPPPTQGSPISPSMRVLWRLHQEQLRLVETSVLYKGPKKMELTFLGGGYESIFQGSPKALRLAGSFHGLQIGGFVLSSIGLGATLAGTLIVIITPQAVVQSTAGGVLGPELFWGLLLGGTALSLIGSILAQSSYGMLYRAVDIYNRETFEKIFRDANQGQLPQAQTLPKQRTLLYAATP